MVHPALKFLYGLSVILLSIFLQHPVFVAVSFAGALLFYWSVCGTKGGRTLLWILAAAVVMAALNPLLSAQGETVLARLPWGRPLTAEAIVFGVLTGGSCAAVLLWFAAFGRCGAGDTILYLFSAALPNLSLVLVMVLRLLPLLRQKADDIRTARAGLGKEEDGAGVFSGLASQALEGAMRTAESMRSRGCGCGRRTSFGARPASARDGVLLGVFACVLALLAFGGMRGALRWQCYPVVWMSGGPLVTVMAVCYAVLVLWPSVRNLAGRLSWKFFQSKI